jgi:hypothetical protein
VLPACRKCHQRYKPLSVFYAEDVEREKRKEEERQKKKAWQKREKAEKQEVLPAKKKR